MGNADCVAGKITSSVNINEIPKQNGESNFGCIGNPYTYDTDGSIAVFLEDGEYHTFMTNTIE